MSRTGSKKSGSAEVSVSREVRKQSGTPFRQSGRLPSEQEAGACVAEKNKTGFKAPGS